ncbi:MAG: isoprenylcysteine carboxyl methyltransferase family protein [Sandaracinaceae bacterium]
MSRVLFASVVGLVAGQRLMELRTSARHESKLRAAGAVEHAAEQMPFMRALHGLWLASCIAEVFLLKRRASLPTAIGATLAFGAGQLLRRSAMRALGERWNVRVLVLPGQPPVSGGPFRYVRHPNYLGVALEMAALPAMHGAFVTAIGFSIANAVLLRARIRAEEDALESTGGRYLSTLGDRGRLIPMASP